MESTLRPPFRADAVGSYLRTENIRNARDRHAAGEIDDAALRDVEDQEIRLAITQQESLGLQAVTDGEYRRAYWHFDFFGGLDGIEIGEGPTGMDFQGMKIKPLAVQIVGKVGFPSDHPMLRHFSFVRDHTDRVAKMTIPSPTVLHFRLASESLLTPMYPTTDSLFEDLAAAYRDAVSAFYEAGCRYLQFDDTAWAYLCSDAELAKARARGIDVDNIQAAYVRLINDSIRDKPADMVITTHVCRGNFRSSWIASGGYEPVAENLLAGCNYDGYFLEYDSERAGGFEPLRFLPHGNKVVVLGLITSKSGDLEDQGDVEKRIAEATKYAPLEQLALSPQCGFASTEEGNVLTQDQQWAKIREVVDIAHAVWR
ncbi:5-methyltetrahydropteroyltriglutamate--homocysteine S-methyltransferase [Leifsonia sp. Root112D2]|jgi:5-methyltetrahydropteroyltriglutamate--homocysteine methyltransferase|uniref:5-methyltetrahydropteroyltriglutamate-- homocysteine S-methyltransferase n=1 Tax=Leifsonia sp. Root112D2 TaxID=1736426 RepID=UPI0006F3E8CB|nr:5-methyltetrahydropteroyltriglutamate--homocysteine S-methyltransferase [Leifsonia sp. Root112D2]KQV06413.1 methionine synthase [Leifsonia sp. Root112D2]